MWESDKGNKVEGIGTTVKRRKAVREFASAAAGYEMRVSSRNPLDATHANPLVNRDNADWLTMAAIPLHFQAPVRSILMTLDNLAIQELTALRAADLERSLRTVSHPGGHVRIEGRDFVNFSSNDYLGLARHPAVVDAGCRALRAYGSGAGASRLVTGTLPVHEALEATLAEWKGYPSALLFGSGYLANCGIIPALVSRHDVVCADRLIHASLLDGIRLSGARLRRYRHNRMDHLERLLAEAPPAARKLVVTESVFSMDGDLAPLEDIVAAATRHGAIVLVDDAHAVGLFGARGAGCVARSELREGIDLCVGTLSKSLGSYGGFVACTKPVRDLLINRVRSFIFTTGLPPASAAAALAAIGIAREGQRGRETIEKAAYMREVLRRAGLRTGASASPIVPVIVSKNRSAVNLSRRLRERGILVVAIRPPTVPENTARIRLSVTYEHTRQQLEMAAAAIAEAVAEENVNDD